MRQQAAPYLYDALNAAANGMRVLPGHGRTGQPLVDAEASADPQTIKDWWDQFPQASPVIFPIEPKKIKATPFVWRDPKEIPRRQFLYGTHLIRKFGSATFAAGGVGKSILKLTEAIALSSGRPLLGVAIKERCRVWYWNGEDPIEETERRIAAICQHHGVERDDIEDWLFIDSGREQKIIIAQMNPKTGAMIVKPVVDAVVGTIQQNKIDVLIIDPFISSHRVTENDNPAIDLVAKEWTGIADVTGCAIELVHHIKKTGGAEATVEDGRGAVSLLAAVRSAQVLNRMSQDEAAKAGVDNHREYFKVENGKANLSPPPNGVDWFRIVSVRLPNGDSALQDNGDNVGVVVSWKWPDPMEGVTGADFEMAAQAIKAGCWRENVQSADWVGRPVAQALRLDLDDRKDKAKVVGLLKIWTKAGSLRVVEALDAKSNARKFVEVSE